MQFSITIESNDAHAAEDPRGLAIESMTDIAKLIEVGHNEGNIRDNNGNRVGHWVLNHY